MAGLTKAQHAKKLQLLRAGCTEDKDISNIVWYGAHCFLIHKNGKVEEL